MFKKTKHENGTTYEVQVTYNQIIVGLALSIIAVIMLSRCSSSEDCLPDGVVIQKQVLNTGCEGQCDCPDSGLYQYTVGNETSEAYSAALALEGSGLKCEVVESGIGQCGSEVTLVCAGNIGFDVYDVQMTWKLNGVIDVEYGTVVNGQTYNWCSMVSDV
jgi:hypothetical protein